MTSINKNSDTNRFVKISLHLKNCVVQISVRLLLFIINSSLFKKSGVRGGVVVEALRYKPAVRGFDSRWCHWNFSVT